MGTLAAQPYAQAAALLKYPQLLNARLNTCRQRVLIVSQSIGFCGESHPVLLEGALLGDQHIEILIDARNQLLALS